MGFSLVSGKRSSLSDPPFYSARTLSVAQCFITKGVDKSPRQRPDISHARVNVRKTGVWVCVGSGIYVSVRSIFRACIAPSDYGSNEGGVTWILRRSCNT